MSSYRRNHIKSEISVSDNSNNNNVPVLQQINSLNSQPVMQVRRPSDLNSSFTQQPSQHSTHNVQKSPVITQLDSKATPLNLINEESSVKEQSDNYAYESLLQKKKRLPTTHDYLIKEPVHWSQIFTHPGTNKEENYYNKYAEYLSDTSFDKEAVLGSDVIRANPLIIIVEVLLYFFYLYSISFILYGVAFTNYKQIYNLQIQLPLLLLNFIIFGLHIQKASNFFDYLPLASFIPFIATLVDFNQQVIFLQLIHTITFIRFYQIITQLLNIAICFQIYTIYFIIMRISQLHIVQVVCGFILVISSSDQIHQEPNQFYQTYSIVNILLTTNNSSALIYPLKLFLVLFFIYECTITGEYIINVYRNQNTIIQGLNEISKIISTLPFNLRFESIKITKKQIAERINVRNLLDYEKLPEQLQRKLLIAQYSKLLKKVPILDLCLSQKSIQRILRYAAKERVLEPNETLYDIDQENPYLYFLLSGKVRCYQKRGNKKFNLGYHETGIYNQYAFFFSKPSEMGIQCITCCKVLEINWEQFWREVRKNLNEYEKIKMFLDRVQFNSQLRLIAADCLLCRGNHLVDECKKVHYVPPRQMLLDHIYFDENNQRNKFERRNIDRKFRCILNNGMIEQVVCNVRHLLLLSTSTYRKPKTIKTITSLGLQLEQQPHSEGSDAEQNRLSQYLQNLSPVQYVPQVGSSASSYMLKEMKQAQLKSPKDSFMVHQKRYQEKRQSHVTKIERGDLSPSIIKYATIQDKKSQKSRSIISEDHGGILQSSDNRQFSKYGIQSSKFTNETAKQFMSNPFDMPLYDLNQSIDNNQSYSDYYPRNNLEQALLSYKQYQDSIISNRSKHS